MLNSISRLFFLSFFVFSISGAQASEELRIEESLSCKSPIRVISSCLEKIESDFDLFCKLSQQRRDNLLTLRILQGFAEMHNIGPDFSKLRNWILNEAHAEIMLPLKDVAKLFATKTKKDITEKTLQSYVEGSKEASQKAFLVAFLLHQSRTTQALKSVSSDLHVMHPTLNLQDLSGFIEIESDFYVEPLISFDTNGSMGVMPPCVEKAFSPKDMEEFLRLFAIQMGYEKAEEFLDVVDTLKKENKVEINKTQLFHDFSAFSMTYLSKHEGGVMPCIPDVMEHGTFNVFLGDTVCLQSKPPKNFDVTKGLEHLFLKKYQSIL